MDPAAIERALRLGEDSLTEFKSVERSGFRLDAHDLAKAIVALANLRGGMVLVGVEDDGRPTGVGTPAQADALMRQISQVCQLGVHPAITCPTVRTEAAGVHILVVEVPEFGPDRPYREAKGAYYVRDGNRSREATRDELVRLLQSVDHHLDEQPVEGATRADLDEVAVRDFLTLAYRGLESSGDPLRYLPPLRCLDERTGVPTVAGLLFFGREPARWLPDARISAARLPGTAFGTQFLDRKEFAGRLLEQLDGVLAFLRLHLPAASHVEGMNRVEEGIPDEALRESLANALAHRDYRAASQIRVFVFDDRAEIVNPGTLLNRLTLDSVRVGGISQRRNPVVASLLARARLRENFGLGVPEMVALMRARGLPEPELSVDGGHFRVVLRLKRI